MIRECTAVALSEKATRWYNGSATYEQCMYKKIWLLLSLWNSLPDQCLKTNRCISNLNANGTNNSGLKNIHLCWSKIPAISSGFWQFLLPKYCSKHVSKFKTVQWFNFSWSSSVLFNTYRYCFFSVVFHAALPCQIMIRSFFGYCIFLWSTKINAGPPKVSSLVMLVDRMSANVQSAISKTVLL